MRPVLWLPLVLAGALVSSTATADGSSTEVHLRDGSIFRGELVEKIVGDHITIKLATGEIRMIRWADLAPETTPPRAPAPPSSPAADPNKIEVEVKSSGDTVQLQRMSGIGEGAGYVGGRAVAISLVHYDPICESPCATSVDPQATYRVAGTGITPSDEFTMRQGESPLRLQVTPGSSSARGWGWISTSTGISFVALGALSWALLGRDPDPTDATYRFSSPQQLQSDTDRAQTFRTIGIVAIATGAVLTVTGILLIATNGTTVKTEKGRTIGSAAPPPPPPKLTAAGLVF